MSQNNPIGDVSFYAAILSASAASGLMNAISVPDNLHFKTKFLVVLICFLATMAAGMIVGLVCEILRQKIAHESNRYDQVCDSVWDFDEEQDDY